MERFNFDNNFVFDDNELDSNLLNNMFVKNKMQELDLTKDDVMQNYFLFKEYAEVKNKCYRCDSLNNCTQKIKGCYDTIGKNEGYLYDAQKLCKFKRKYEDECKYQKNFFVDLRPIEMRNLTIDDIINDKCNEDLKKIAKKIQNKVFTRNSLGLYITGDVGLGKTYLMTALANELAKQNYRVSFITLNMWIKD